MTVLPEKYKNDRIAKVIARAGVCSRREAERRIDAGRVTVNGKILDTPAYKVALSDTILIDGEPLPKISAARLWLYHKPTGEITTHDDPGGRSTVFDNLPIDRDHIIAVGRLDINSEGLLLLTNDGELARQLEHPKNGIARRYKVRVYGDLIPGQLNGLKTGVRVEGVHYGPIFVDILDKNKNGRNHWLSVTLHEGKNREIRKVMDHLGLSVNRLSRTAYGPFKLGDLSPGGISEISENKVKQFQKSLENKA